MIASKKQPNEIRCAIYTRKSTTEGLEQEFNSLDAQRESGAAYIASQRGEGWVEVETRYDDGGFTGGNMDRPALKQLLADIRGWRTKTWETKAGKTVGGVQFNKNGLHALLTNRIYLGKVTHHDEVYEGEHDAIVEPKTFKLVQKKLRGNRIHSGDRVHGRSQGVLAGLIHCSVCNSSMTHSSSRKRNKLYRYYVCNKATKRGRKTCPRPSLPAEEVERFVIAQLQSLTIDESLLNETCLRVRTSITTRGQRLEQELMALATDIYRTEKAIDALSMPATDAGRESVRLESLASLGDQLRRDQKRRKELNDQLTVVQSATPSRVSILKAINDLATLWEHLTVSERSRLMSMLIERIDHDPTDSTLSITLSPTGLQSFGTQTTEPMHEPHPVQVRNHGRRKRPTPRRFGTS